MKKYNAIGVSIIVMFMALGVIGIYYGVNNSDVVDIALGVVSIFVAMVVVYVENDMKP